MDTTEHSTSIKYFMYEASTHTEITVNDAIEINLKDALNLFFKLIPEKGNYIGFVTNNSQVLQFMSLGITNSYLLDIPDPSQNGSLQKTTDFEECYSAINSLFNGGDNYEIKDVTFKKW